MMWRHRRTVEAGKEHLLCLISSEVTRSRAAKKNAGTSEVRVDVYV